MGKPQRRWLLCRTLRMGSVLITEERGKSTSGRRGRISKGQETGTSLECPEITESVHFTFPKVEMESGYEKPGVLT